MRLDSMVNVPPGQWKNKLGCEEQAHSVLHFHG